MELKRVNLGCGRQYWKDWVNIDISKEIRADHHMDAGKEDLPFEDNEVDEVVCGCMLEQIHDNKEFIHVLNEVHRVLKKGGVFRGYVPSTQREVMFLDPMDYRFFQLESFEYFDVDKHAYREFGKVYGLKPWWQIKVKQTESGIIHFEMKPYK